MITVNIFILIIAAVILVLVGWFGRKQMEKVRPDEVARADRYGNTAVDQSSAFVKSAEQRAQDALNRTRDGG